MHGVITELPRATIDKCNLLVLSKNYVRKKLERVNGIEPSSLAWEARVITIIRHPQYGHHRCLFYPSPVRLTT